MRKRFLILAVAVTGWVLFAPTPWAGLASAQQTTLLDTTTTATNTSLGTNPRGSGYPANAHQVQFQAGGSYTMRTYTGSSISDSGYYDSYMYLLDPSNTVVAQDDDSGGNLSSMITFTPKTGGTYTIIVTTWSQTSSIKYRLLVTGTPPTAGAAGIPNVRLAPPPRDLAAPQPVPLALDLGSQPAPAARQYVAAGRECSISAVN
jgi:hypothetical protein